MMLTLPSVFSDHMIFQREKPIRIWGQADPDSTLTVSIADQTCTTDSDTNGNWSLEVPALPAIESTSLVISTEHETLTLQDVAVGEVWVAGGQSNMEFHMRYEKHLKEALTDCVNPHIRFYDVPEACFDGHTDAFDYSRMGFWRTATPKDLEYFSAVGYYFEKELEADLDVPVGIIGCNWGGTTSFSWMSRETAEQVAGPWLEKEQAALKTVGDLKAYYERQKHNPMNDRGNPFADPFGEFTMPKTVTADEFLKFIASLNFNPENFITDVMPQSLGSCLYEHMLKTIAPFTIKGFLWYQGESDDESGLADLYDRMLTAMISDWRALWGDPTLPFLIVQLPGFQQWLNNPPGNHYPVIRQHQETVAKTVPNTYLCSISDVGEQYDIHPKNKLAVGHRLALLAKGHVYGEAILCDAPTVRTIETSGNRILLHFDNAGDGLKIKGDRLSAMHLLAGTAELSFRAEVQHDTLILILDDADIASADELTIAFAKTSWYHVNLYNSADIPAIPFCRTMTQ